MILDKKPSGLAPPLHKSAPMPSQQDARRASHLNHKTGGRGTPGREESTKTNRSRPSFIKASEAAGHGRRRPNKASGTASHCNLNLSNDINSLFAIQESCHPLLKFGISSIHVGKMIYDWRLGPCHTEMPAIRKDFQFRCSQLPRQQSPSGPPSPPRVGVPSSAAPMPREHAAEGTASSACACGCVRMRGWSKRGGGEGPRWRGRARPKP